MPSPEPEQLVNARRPGAAGANCNMSEYGRDPNALGCSDTFAQRGLAQPYCQLCCPRNYTEQQRPVPPCTQAHKGRGGAGRGSSFNAITSNRVN